MQGGGMQGGPRPQHGNGNFGGNGNHGAPEGNGGQGNGGQGFGGHGNAGNHGNHGDNVSASPTGAPPSSHDPDSSGNA